MKAYQSHSIKRQVRRNGISEQGAQTFRVKSFTNQQAPAVYRPTIQHTTGRVSCDCKDFFYRHAQAAPTIHDSAHHCKHVAQAVRQCKRRGELCAN